MVVYHWSLTEPDRHRETAVGEGRALGAHGAHLMEVLAREEHDAVVDRVERRVRRGRRAAGRRDPRIVQLQLAAREAARARVEVIDARDAPIGGAGVAGVDVRREETAAAVRREL